MPVDDRLRFGKPGTGVVKDVIRLKTDQRVAYRDKMRDRLGDIVAIVVIVSQKEIGSIRAVGRQLRRLDGFDQRFLQERRNRLRGSSSNEGRDQ